MKAFILILLFPFCAFAQNWDHDRSEAQMVELAKAKYRRERHKAGRQSDWAVLYQEVSRAAHPKMVVLPRDFKAGLDKSFLFWVVENLSDEGLGDIIVFRNCWHIYGVEIRRNIGFVDVCMKYGKLSNRYLPFDSDMRKEYEEAFGY